MLPMSPCDYPSPDTASSDCGNLYDPSPNSSFGSIQVPKADPESKDEGECRDEAVAGLVDEQVQRALEIVRAKRDGRPLPIEHDDWIELEFTPAQYSRLHEELGLLGLDSFFNTTIRHDYNPQTNTLVFRMPSPIHDAFGVLLFDKINIWIHEVQKKPLPHATRAIISSILPVGTSDITLQVPSGLVPSSSSENRVKTARHSPDGQFAYLGHRHPPFIMEIGYSSKGKGKKAKNLPGLAKYYYEDVDIKTVLTIDLAYMPKARRRRERTQRQTRAATAGYAKQAAFSLYRGPDCIVSDQLLRDQAGEPVQGEGLLLYMSDLIPDAVLRQDQTFEQPDFTFHISAQELFDLLVKSETVQQNREKTASVPPEDPEPRKRKVTWAIDDSSSDGRDGESQDEHKQDALLASSSKRRRTCDAAYSSGSRPSTRLGVRTRSSTRASTAVDDGSSCNSS